MPETSVLGQLLARAADTPHGVHFVHSGNRESRVSYAALLARSRSLLGWLQHRGLKPGDALVLFVRNNRAFIDAFWACQLGGMIPVPLSAGVQAASLAKLVSVGERVEGAWLLSERQLYQRLKQAFGNGQVFDQRLCLLEEIQTLETQGVVQTSRADDLALIQFSSGSTSEPKGVQLTHANLLANLRAITRGADISAGDCTLSWMPLSHDMGLIGFHLVPLFNRLEQVVMDTEAFIRRPALWLEKAAATRATLLCSPNFGYQHYLNNVAKPGDALDLRAVRLVFNGAEPVAAKVCRDFLLRLAGSGLRSDTMFPVYGLAEASLAVCFPSSGSGLQTVQISADSWAVGDTVAPDARARELVCLGFPVDGCELRIADDQGNTLPDHTHGHIQIRGDSVTAGYYRCPECDRDSFVDGWLDSGDLGVMTERGLVVTGRVKEVFFAAGQNWYPQDVERLLEAAGCAERGKVAVSAVRSDDNAEDRLLVFLQHRGPLAAFAPLAAAVQAALAATAGLRAHAVIPLHRLPRTTSGKLQRYRLAAAFGGGEYDQVLGDLDAASLDSQAGLAASRTERQLLELCRRRFPGHDIRAERNLFELGADSLTLVGLHEDIETAFPGRVEITDLFDYPTVRELAAFIER